jgi:putative membrane protein
MTSLESLPGFITHFLAGLVMLAGATYVHIRFTPHDDLALIRRGNVPCAVSLGGTVLGFAIPIASAIAHSANLLDAVVWGVIALLAQLFAWFAVARLLGSARAEAMEEVGAMARAVLKAAVAVAVGALNAGAMST